MFIEPKFPNSHNSENKNVYLSKARRLPPLLTALAILALILLSVLWILPHIFAPAENTRTEENAEENNWGQAQEHTFTHGEQVLVKVGECPLFENSRARSKRVSTALYGERAEILELEGKMAKLRFADAFEAWATLQNISADISAVDKANYRYKILVLSPYKSLMSHSINGYPLFRAPMGSFLYADHDIADILRLRLTDGQHAWISHQGVQILEPDEAVPVPDESAELFMSTAMNFKNSPYVPGGMSKEGADMAGVLFIAARINGLELPRDLNGQSKAGEEVAPVKNPETGYIRPELLEAGDVIFFRSPEDKNKVDRAAIILEEGQALCHLTNGSTIQIKDLNRQNELLAEVLTIRRFFAE